MYVTRGWTKEAKRKYVLGECPAVEQIAELYLLDRPEGGRILLKTTGLFYKPFGKGSDVRFAEVEFEGGVNVRGVPLLRKKRAFLAHR